MRLFFVRSGWTCHAQAIHPHAIEFRRHREHRKRKEVLQTDNGILGGFAFVGPRDTEYEIPTGENVHHDCNALPRYFCGNALKCSNSPGCFGRQQPDEGQKLNNMGTVHVRRITALPGLENIGNQKAPLVGNGKYPLVHTSHPRRYFKRAWHRNITLAETTRRSIRGCTARNDATTQWIALWRKWDSGVSTRRPPQGARTSDHSDKEKSGCSNGKMCLSVGCGPLSRAEFDI